MKIKRICSFCNIMNSLTLALLALASNLTAMAMAFPVADAINTARSSSIKIAIIETKLLQLLQDKPQLLDRLPQPLRESFVRAMRMRKCIEMLGSRRVCDNNVSFYLWAQFLARDILAGKYDNYYVKK